MCIKDGIKCKFGKGIVRLDIKLVAFIELYAVYLDPGENKVVRTYRHTYSLREQFVVSFASIWCYPVWILAHSTSTSLKGEQGGRWKVVSPCVFSEQ